MSVLEKIFGKFTSPQPQEKLLYDEVIRHSKYDECDRKVRCVSWSGNKKGWSYRSSCDECRASLAYMGSNLYVSNGTPILCGPCITDDDVRAKWSILA
jgi:hypothetical protein